MASARLLSSGGSEAAKRCLPAVLCLAAGLLSLATTLGEEASTGTVEGAVTNDTGEPVAGARVAIEGTPLEAVTDDAGRYRLAGVPAGPQRVSASAAGMLPFGQPVTVLASGTVTSDLVLLPSDDVDTFTVIGRLPRASETRVLLDRREAAGAGEIISREEISRSSDSDVGEIMTRAPGTTVVGGKFAYVRGLGERYSQTLLNGLSIPSPEPDKRVVPLDLFPATIIESIELTKTYSPDLPGEFSGGSVRITTIDAPDDGFVKLAVSSKYLHGTTFRDFRTYQGGNFDAFSFDDGMRALPGAVPQDRVVVGSGDRGLTAEEVQRIGRSFRNVWDVDTTTAPPEFKLALSFGDRVGTSESHLGVVGAIEWGNTYQKIEDEKFRLVKNEGTIENPDPQVFNDFTLSSSTHTAEVTGLLNLSWRIDPGQTVGLRNVYTDASDDLVRLQEGHEGQQDRPARFTRLRWVERGLFSTQAYGEHLLIFDSLLDWHLAYALSQRDQPDERQVRYDFIEFVNDFALQDVSGSGSRDFFLLDENTYDLGWDLSIPFAPFWENPEPDLTSNRPEQMVKVGMSYVERDRDFDSRRFRFTPVSGSPVGDDGQRIDLTAPPETIFRRQNINSDGFQLEEVTRPTDNYDAKQRIWAGYGLVDIRLGTEKLRLIGGARVEVSRQEVTTFELFGEDPDTTVARLETTDVLPAVNLVWKFIEKHQLRLGASRTVTRPEFRELAEFEYRDVEGGFAARGNPDLERGKILNLDLRWEWFPLPGDVVSASAFFKDFENPIEQVIIPTGSSPITTWENAGSAQLFGFEIETRKSLAFLDDILDTEGFRGFSLVGNLAFIESEVSIGADQSGVQTNDNRPLQGQPDYVLNFGLAYENPNWGFNMGIFANRFGERISNVGAFGVPDEVEESRWSVDLALGQKVGEGALKLTLENITDESFTWTQGDITTREYRKGWALGLSYSLSF